MISDTFNIASLLTEAAEKWPARLAVIASHRPDVLGQSRLTFRELDVNSSRLATYFIREGVLPGTRIIVMVRPGLDFVVIAFALFKAGLVPVMVDPGMGVSRMLRCLAEGRAGGIIGLPLAHILSLTAPNYFRSIKFRVTVGRRWGWGGATLKEIMTPKPNSDSKDGSDSNPKDSDTASPVELPVPTSADDTAAILFTSGSTGPAKGAIYTHSMFRAQVEAIRDSFDIQEGGVDLVTFPLFGLFSPALGLTSIIPDMNPGHPAKADPRQLLEPIIKHSVTSMFASPTILDIVGRFAHEHSLTLPSLRRVIAAGAPVFPRVVASFASLMSGEGKIMTPYGATEGVPLSCIEADEITSQTKVSTEQGLGMCVGRAIAGVSLGVIKIKDQPIPHFSEDLLLPAGEIGEIVAKGPMVSPAYFERPRDTALSIMAGESEGEFWRRMGDVGWLDTKGRLWFCGRKSQRVLTSHGTLYTIPCEAIFNNHPQVRRTALVGVGVKGQQQPVIVVEPHSTLKGPSWQTLVEELKVLAKTNPRTINITTFFKYRSFPVDARHNAKINREKLAAWVARELAKDFI